MQNQTKKIICPIYVIAKLHVNIYFRYHCFCYCNRKKKLKKMKIITYIIL